MCGGVWMVVCGGCVVGVWMRCCVFVRLVCGQLHSRRFPGKRELLINVLMRLDDELTEHEMACGGGGGMVHQ